MVSSQPVTGEKTHYTRDDLIALGMEITPGLQRMLDKFGGVMPRISGADGSSDDEAKKKAEAEAEAKKKADAEAEAKKKAEAEEDDDPEVKDEAAKEVLRRERKKAKDEAKARREAEKRADEAEQKVKEREDAEASEADKAMKRAEEAEGKLKDASVKLRQANLLSALAEEGLTGARGKAAARLLDDVEYDDSDEPTNLKDAIKAAKDEYGEELFEAESGDGNGGKGKPRGRGGDGGSNGGRTEEEHLNGLRSLFPQLRGGSGKST